MNIYRGYEIKLEDGKYEIHKDGHRVYRLETTNTEEAAMDWVDAEKRCQAQTH